MRKKEFNIKIFSLAGALVRTLSPNVIMGDFSFRMQLNGGQGEMRIKLNLPFDSQLITYNQIIKIYETDTKSPNGRLIYSGIVGYIDRNIDKTGEFIEVRAIGLSSILSFFYFNSGSSYTPSLNQEISLTIKAIIDYATTKYPGLLSYTGSSIDTTGVTANLTFNYTKCLDAITNASVSVPWYFYIDASGVLNYHARTYSGQRKHYLTIGTNIESLKSSENTEKVVNKYIMSYNTTSFVTSVDAGSTSTYGLRESFESNSVITNSTTAQSKADGQISKMKDYKKNIVIIVNDEYDIESIQPGDLVTVRNSNYPIQDLQVSIVEYGVSNARIELESINSLAQEILT